MVHFDETSVKQCYQTGHFKRTKKLMENSKNQKFDVQLEICEFFGLNENIFGAKIEYSIFSQCFPIFS